MAEEIDNRDNIIADLREQLKRSNELQREAELKAKEAQKALEMKSMALARMSHDIRTPLNGVVGMVSLLQTTPLSAEQSEFVETIHSSSSFLLELLRDILDHSKMEAGKIDLESSPFNVVNVVNECVRTLSYEAAKRDIPIVVNTNMSSFGIPENVIHIGDALRFKQIVLNYLSNAIKFSNPNEKVNVNMYISSWDDEYAKNDCVDELRIEVSDTGIGIKDPSKLFAPFTQASPCTSRQYGGSGLGLSIARALTELMDGEVGVSSEPGKGTTVWSVVRLPRLVRDSNTESTLPCGETTKETQVSSGTDDNTWKETFRILVAEDNRVNQKVLVHTLKRLGFCHIEITEDGFSAWESIRLSYELDDKCRYDLILMDCQMPVMDGMEASRAIRVLENDIRKSRNLLTADSTLKTPHIPIVALTASALDSDREICLASGMDDFVTKPIDMRRLDQIISHWAHNAQNQECVAVYTV